MTHSGTSYECVHVGLVKPQGLIADLQCWKQKKLAENKLRKMFTKCLTIIQQDIILG